jgi:ABC-2 type transport system permease protein
VSELTGTSILVRFAMRRDRIRILVWIVAIVILVVATAASIKGIFPTQADFDQAAAASAHNAAAIAFNGPVQGLDTVGGEVAYQAGTFGLIVVGLMSLLMIGRLTRAEEESGRTELLRATVLGRDAQTAAALIVVTAMNVLIGLAVALSLLIQGMPTTGSLVFGASFIALGLVFSGVGLVAAQVTESSRVASGIAGGVLGLAFALRAAGDIGNGRLSWLSPIGWSQKARPFAGEQWWPLLVPLGFTIALAVAARALTAHRDLGAGMVQPRRGPAVAPRSLGRPLGLAVRLQRGTVIAWSAGLLLLGFVYGSVANDIQSLIGDSETMKEFIARTGGASLTDAYFGTALLSLALIGSGFAIQSAQRLRTEETALHAEAVLATGVSRARWVASHLAVSLGGSVIVLTAAGLGAAVPYAIVTHDLGQVPRIVGATLVHLPAVWLLAGVAVALFGLVPRATSVAWAALAACVVIGFFGDLLKLPGWVMGLSPFEHTPQLPAAGLTVMPLVTLVAIAAGLIATGFGAFRQRDVG